MSIEGGAIDLSSCQKTVKWSCLLMQNQESACWFVDPSHFFPNLYLKNWKNDLILATSISDGLVMFWISFYSGIRDVILVMT